jgi:hypothetical protein
VETVSVDKQVVHDEMERARATFHQLLDQAIYTDLRRSTNGTRWSNRQLLFHMLFGYLITRALLGLVGVFGRLPTGVSLRFARLLDAVAGPFDVVNYAGSWFGGSVLGRRQMEAMFDRVIAALHRRLDRESDRDLARGMHYPTRWDPFFRDYTTLAEVYRFPTQHFDFHRGQLTLDPGDRPGSK